jgi:hypothetical protein
LKLMAASVQWLPCTCVGTITRSLAKMSTCEAGWPRERRGGKRPRSAAPRRAAPRRLARPPLHVRVKVALVGLGQLGEELRVVEVALVELRQRTRRAVSSRHARGPAWRKAARTPPTPAAAASISRRSRILKKMLMTCGRGGGGHEWRPSLRGGPGPGGPPRR